MKKQNEKENRKIYHSPKMVQYGTITHMTKAVGTNLASGDNVGMNNNKST